ncbi:hypothetical protein JTB14_011853 [Gonioctena quinquepunctata]|nr:hypothetical protein JTB14_011853 [Gonioctena quinquepunctata]
MQQKKKTAFLCFLQFKKAFNNTNIMKRVKAAPKVPKTAVWCLKEPAACTLPNRPGKMAKVPYEENSVSVNSVFLQCTRENYYIVQVNQDVFHFKPLNTWFC